MILLAWIIFLALLMVCIFSRTDSVFSKTLDVLLAILVFVAMMSSGVKLLNHYFPIKEPQKVECVR
jgi:hypothetical protein